MRENHLRPQGNTVSIPKSRISRWFCEFKGVHEELGYVLPGRADLFFLTKNVVIAYSETISQTPSPSLDTLHCETDLSTQSQVHEPTSKQSRRDGGFYGRRLTPRTDLAVQGQNLALMFWWWKCERTPFETKRLQKPSAFFTMKGDSTQEVHVGSTILARKIECSSMF